MSLKNLTKPQLIQKCKDLGISKYSKLNKADIIKLIQTKQMPYLTKNPFTQNQVDEYNRYTHFPIDLNKDFNEEIEFKEDEIKEKLRKHNIKKIPPEVESVFNQFKKATYNYYLNETNIRAYAPPVYVVGPAKYKTKRLDEAHKKRGKNIEQYNQTKDWLDKTVKKYIKGDLEPIKTINDLQDLKKTLTKNEMHIQIPVYIAKQKYVPKEFIGEIIEDREKAIKIQTKYKVSKQDGKIVILPAKKRTVWLPKSQIKSE